METIQWINNTLGIGLTLGQIAQVQDFSLIWNIFDSTVCNTSCSVDTIANALQNKTFNMADFSDALEYFRNRYTDNGATNQRFEMLYFRANDRRDFVRDVLLGQINDTGQSVLAIAIIVYRFRNNLFHGLKEMRNIHEQDDNFRHANNFLKTLITNYFI